MMDKFKKQGMLEVYMHVFTHRRDTDPKSGLGFITELEANIKESTGKIATVSGRYYAMDRDNRWERVKLAYDAMVKGLGEKATDPAKAIEASYNKNVTDEFIIPTVLTDSQNQPVATIGDGDEAICLNFRTDKCSEIN